MIANLPNFPIESNLPLSSFCHQLGLKDFQSAANYIFKLPYRRNSSKEDLTLVFSEQCGVCSTKHAALAALSLENDFSELKLIVGIYQMNEANTPGVGVVLEKTDLEFMPEAHTYLFYKNNRIDVTREVDTLYSPFDTLMMEKEIQPDQIGGFKVQLHRSFLEKWLSENELDFNLEELWEIREKCILALSV